MNTDHTGRLRALYIGLASLAVMSTADATPVKYSFDMTVGATSVTGFFVIDGASSNYVGGGTTNKADLLDYSLTFSQGATFVGSPSNSSGIQTFNMTYAPNVSSVTNWDLSLGFNNLGNYALGYAGNNISGGGFAQVADFGQLGIGASTFPAPALQTSLQSGSVSTYNFDMQVGKTSVTGFFAVDAASSNYAGGGTTTKADLVDYSFTFFQGSKFVGAPSNSSGIQTFDITYSADLKSVTNWDFSLGFNELSQYVLGFAGNNISGGGFAQVADFGHLGIGASTFPAPTLRALLLSDPQPNSVPTPTTLSLIGLGLAGLAWTRRRSAAPGRKMGSRAALAC